MKNFLFVVFAVLLSVSLRAQTATVTSSAQTYDAAGGQITFSVGMTYPAGVSAAGFTAKAPAVTWAFVSTGGANIPGIKPQAGETTDPTNPASEFGWTYSDDPGPPASPVSFTFVLNYPAGLSGNQTFTFSALTRLNGALTPITVAPITLTPTPVAPVITTQPANATVAAGAAASFTVAATGVPVPTYKWQRSLDGGATFADLSSDGTFSGVTTATLTVSNVSLALTAQKFRAIASNGTLPNATSTAALLTVTQAPNIGSQPASQTVVVGATAGFGVTATGSGTLTYQWYFTPAGSSTPQSLTNLVGKISGAQTAALSVANTQASDAGDYVCVVSNGVNPAATSNAAQLVVVERLVKAASQTAALASTVVVPIQLLAKGDENAVSFTLEFPFAKLTYTDSSISGTDASTGNLVRNVTQAGSGKLSFAISKQSGETFAAGTRTVLNVTFTVSGTAAGGDVLGVSFTDSLAVRKISNAAATALPGTFVDGTITVSSGLEGDVNGDGVVDLSDWVKLGRMVVGLDPAPTNGATFMKTDCAPRATKGDGTVDLSDWVQAGRFVVGLDTPQPAGGPATPNP